MAYNRKKSVLLTLILSIVAAIVLTPVYFLRRDAGRRGDRQVVNVPLSVDAIPAGTIWGIDVSHHQQAIHWSRMTTKPCFIFLKSTEGYDHTDTRFSQYYAKARARGIVCGAYHFFTYRTGGYEQALNFISHTPLGAGDLPPVLDVEWARKMPSAKKLAVEVTQWMETVEQHYHVRPILYTDEQFYNTYLKGRLRNKYLLWLCDYKDEPHSRWAFWQRTDRFTLEGIRGRVDLNYFNGTRDELVSITIRGKHKE